MIKICTNTPTYQRMSADMDINAGEILDGTSDFATSTENLLDLVIATASGQPTKSEALGVGDAEFVPWTPYGVV